MSRRVRTKDEREAILVAAERVLHARNAYEHALTAYNELLDRTESETDEAQRERGPPAHAPVDMRAVPPLDSTSSVRDAVLVFLAAQHAPVPQDAVEAVFAMSGYSRSTVRQALYDLSSVKSATINRSAAGVILNAKGRSWFDAFEAIQRLTTGARAREAREAREEQELDDGDRDVPPK